MATFRELSKQNFNSQQGDTIYAINAGSLQRIADATELMARNYIQLQADLAFYKRRYDQEIENKGKLYRQISALKGVITKLKNKK